MKQQMLPERPEELSFSRSFFGYDPLEVKAFIAEVKDQMDLLEARHGSLISGNGAVKEQDLAVVIDSAVSDIADVLEAARVAARKIRDRADHDASDGLAAAAEQVRKLVASAEAEAFALRRAAWDTSTEVLESVKAERGRLRVAAERDALDIIGDAERKAHRKLAASRRDSENAIQMASVETERLLDLARATGREIIRAAEEQAEEANERVAALEERHEELLQEVEIFRSKLEGPSGHSDVTQTSTVRVIHSGEAKQDQAESTGENDLLPSGAGLSDDGATVARAHTVGWADGTDNVRLVATPTMKARLEVDALELAEEVARLREAGAGTDTESASDPEHGGANGEPAHTRLVGVPADPPPSNMADRELVRARTWSGVSESRSTDDLAALFLRLRMKEETTAKAPTEVSGPERTLSPLERYNRMLLPVTNRALRGVKRQLIDVQSEQVEALEEDPEGWKPERSGLASYLVHVFSVMERESFERGYTVAAEITGTRLAVLRGDLPGRGSEPFVSALFDEVSMRVQDARDAGLGSQEMSGAVSRVYRAWRTDEAERRLRFLAGRAYHHGLMRGLVEAGVHGFRVEVNKGCAECVALSGQVLAEDEVPMVPVHSECRCTILPA